MSTANLREDYWDPRWPLIARPELFSEEQLRSYHENGFMFFDPELSEAQLEEMVKRFQEIDRTREFPQKMFTVKSTVGPKDSIEKLEVTNFDPVFSRLHVGNPALLRAVHGVVGSSQLSSMSTKFLVRPPGTPMHPAHQDYLYFLLERSGLKHIVGTWIALEDADEENGCLFFVNGSHKADTLYEHVFSGQKGLRRTGYRVVHPDVMREYEQQGKVVTVPVKKGQGVLFHPLVIHGAHANRSDNRTRMVLTAHFRSAAVKRVTRIEDEQQRRLAEDLFRIKTETRKLRGQAPRPPTEANLISTMKLQEVPDKSQASRL